VEVLIAIALVAGAYAWRARSVRHDLLRSVFFASGLTVIAVALLSPIDRLGEERLFSVHMVQHLLLTDVAPILLLLGLSRAMMRPLIRRTRPLEQALGPLAHPATALVVLIVAVCGWHLAAAYEFALHHSWAHQLEHMTFFWAGIAFWWYVIEPVPPRHRLDGLGMLAYVAAAKLALGGLGIALAFSPNAFYDTYVQAPRTWGLTAVEDLNVGGLVMMLEQSIVLVVFFAIVFARMLERSEQAQRRRERLGI
jgi:putative membrane protein